MRHWVITERIRKAPKYGNKARHGTSRWGISGGWCTHKAPGAQRGRSCQAALRSPSRSRRHPGSSALPSADYSIKNKYLLSLSNSSHTRHMCINQYVMWTFAFIAGARNVSSVLFFLCFPTFYCTKVRDSGRDAGKTLFAIKHHGHRSALSTSTEQQN